MPSLSGTHRALVIAAAVAVAGCGGAVASATPTPTATPGPSLTAAPSPTPSPTPDPSPTRTLSPTPTFLPVRTATPEPSPTPRPTPEPEPTPALNKTATFPTFVIDYASPVAKGTYDPLTWTLNNCDPIPIKCPDFWFYTIRFRALPGKSPGTIDLVRVRIYDTDGKEWYPVGQKDFGAIKDSAGDTVFIDFRPDRTDSYAGTIKNEWLGTGPDFPGARVQLEFKQKGSSAVAKISFVLGK